MKLINIFFGFIALCSIGFVMVVFLRTQVQLHARDLCTDASLLRDRARQEGNETESRIQDAQRQPGSILYQIRRYGSVHQIPDNATIYSYDDNQLSLLYHSYMDNIDVVCDRKLRMGRIGDGGYEVCDDYKWRPVPPCIVYSMGINDDFSFDDSVASSYGCNVFSFDPTMKKGAHQHSKLVSFYPLGIGGAAGNTGIWHADSSKIKPSQLHTLNDIRARLHHTEKVIDVLKIDVEGAEWAALQNMIQERQLHNVRQLIVEFHQFQFETKESLRPVFAILRSLWELGFRVFYTHKNPFTSRYSFRAMPIAATCCHEVSYVNVKFTRDIVTT